MNDAEELKLELENHLLRMRELTETWSIAERRSRVELLKAQLIQRGIAIDMEMTGAMEEFASGSLGGDQLLRFFQNKFAHEWRRL